MANIWPETCPHCIKESSRGSLKQPEMFWAMFKDKKKRNLLRCLGLGLSSPSQGSEKILVSVKLGACISAPQTERTWKRHPFFRVPRWRPFKPFPNNLWTYLGSPGGFCHFEVHGVVFFALKKFSPQFWGRKWVRQFYGRLEKCVLSAGKPMSIKFLVLGGGGIFGVFFWGGGGECRFYFYGRADFSELRSHGKTAH